MSSLRWAVRAITKYTCSPLWESRSVCYWENVALISNSLCADVWSCCISCICQSMIWVCYIAPWKVHLALFDWAISRSLTLANFSSAQSDASRNLDILLPHYHCFRYCPNYQISLASGKCNTLRSSLQWWKESNCTTGNRLEGTIFFSVACLKGYTSDFY